MVTTKVTTAAELIQMKDDGWRYELIKGELRRMAPAGMEHGEVGVTFTMRLWNWVSPRGLGRVYPADTGFFLAHEPDTIVAPDASFVRADRLPPPSERRGYSPVVPDLAVEVVSPSDTQPEVDEKVALYMDAGVPLLWVAYPKRRVVRVHRPDREPVEFGEGDVLDGEDVLPGFRLPVADSFR